MLRILVIRLSSIGDIVHALPAVAAVSKTFPEAEIAWVVESRYAELLEGNPFVRRVIPLDTLGWKRNWKSHRTPGDVIRNLRAVRSFQPTAAIDFQGLVKSAVIARLSGARRRVGFGGRWLRERAAGIFYSEHVKAENSLHAVEENLALAERIGASVIARESWQFPLPHSREAEARVERRLASLDTRKFMVINPGGGWTSKRWPPERYAELIRDLNHQWCFPMLITGSPTEELVIRRILERAGSPQAAYFPSTLGEFIALVRRASVFIGGDTGPLHLAAAVGTPIVAIYGPTNPRRNGPFDPEDIVLSEKSNAGSRPQHTHWQRGEARRRTYLEGVPVEAVRAAIQQRLKLAHGG